MWGFRKDAREGALQAQGCDYLPRGAKARRRRLMAVVKLTGPFTRRFRACSAVDTGLVGMIRRLLRWAGLRGADRCGVRDGAMSDADALQVQWGEAGAPCRGKRRRRWPRLWNWWWWWLVLPALP